VPSDFVRACPYLAPPVFNCPGCTGSRLGILRHEDMCDELRLRRVRSQLKSLDKRIWARIESFVQGDSDIEEAQIPMCRASIEDARDLLAMFPELGSLSDLMTLVRIGPLSLRRGRKWRSAPDLVGRQPYSGWLASPQAQESMQGSDINVRWIRPLNDGGTGYCELWPLRSVDDIIYLGRSLRVTCPVCGDRSFDGSPNREELRFVIHKPLVDAVEAWGELWVSDRIVDVLKSRDLTGLIVGNAAVISTGNET